MIHALWILVAVLVSAGPVRAQDDVASDQGAEASADSTAETTLGGLGNTAAANADTSRAGKDAALSRWDNLRPTVTAGWQSNVTRVLIKGSVSAPIFKTFADEGQVRYNETRTEYRQFDREQTDRRLSGNLGDELGPVRLKVDFSRQDRQDENSPAGGTPIVIDFQSSDASMALYGDHLLPEGFEHHWVVAGEIEDVSQTNRGISNDRNLASAGLTSVWKRVGTGLDLTARYGYKRSSGDRFVRGIRDDASAEVDTLSARAALGFVPRSTFSLEAERTNFLEERLDFARNANGAIDTLNAVRPVGLERETRTTDEVRADASVRPVDWLGLQSTGSTQFSETEYRFSDQGLVQRGQDAFDASTTFRYAVAGSLEVRYAYGNSYEDRRVRGGRFFRGRESTRSYEVEALLRQKLFGVSDFEFSASQTLSQSIFEETGNNNDRDRLVDNFRARITSDAFAYSQFQVGGFARRTLDLNIAADRVSNNREESLYEVSSSYTYDPPGGFRASQTVRLQIVFRDVLDGIDRDSFNKQGQAATRASYDFAGGGSVGLEYTIDYRSTGSRDADELVRELYITDSVRNDRRLVGTVDIPLGLFTLSTSGERGFLDQDQRGRESEEERGRLNLRVSGSRSFFGGKVKLDLDVEQVRQFGPRVRDEQREYFVANSTLTVRF